MDWELRTVRTSNADGWSIKIIREAPYCHREHSLTGQDNTVGNDKVTHVAPGKVLLRNERGPEIIVVSAS